MPFSAVAAAVLVLSIASAHAQTYPDRPVRAVVPFPAGGGTDILARLLLQRLGERLNANFVIDNRAGAGGTIGTDIVAKLHEHTGAVLRLGDVRERLLAQGLEPVGNTPVQFAAIISEELVKWKKVVAASGMKAE